MAWSRLVAGPQQLFEEGLHCAEVQDARRVVSEPADAEERVFRDFSDRLLALRVRTDQILPDTESVTLHPVLLADEEAVASSDCRLLVQQDAFSLHQYPTAGAADISFDDSAARSHFEAFDV